MRPLKRDFVYQHYDTIAFHIKGLQESFFDDDVEDDTYYERFDALNVDSRNYETTNFCVRVKSKNKTIHPKDIVATLERLCVDIHLTQFIIIPYLRLYNPIESDTQYPEIINAYDDLDDYFPTGDLTEAIEIDLDELDDILPIIYTLATQDPNFQEYTMWFDKDERFAFFICKRGNLHICDFTERDAISEVLFSQYGFYIDDLDQFD